MTRMRDNRFVLLVVHLAAFSLPGCGFFWIEQPDGPPPLSASLGADRYQLYRAPSWANQTTLRVLPIGGTAPYTYEWAVTAPNGQPGPDCLETVNQNIARFIANGGDGPYVIRCTVQDADAIRYVATTVLQVGGDIGLDITTPRIGVRAGGGANGQTTLQLNPSFGVPQYRVTWVCTGPDGKVDNDRLNVSNPLAPRFTSSGLVGPYVLTANIIDALGQTATESFIIVVGQDLGLDVAAARSNLLPGGGEHGKTQLVATPIGGSEPYTYDWEVVGPDGQTRTELLWDAHSPSPIFESDGDTGTFLARCAVTDSVGTVLMGSIGLTVGQHLTIDVVADRLALPTGPDAGQQARLSATVRGGREDVTLAWEVMGPDGEDASSLLSSTSDVAVVFTPSERAGSYVVRCHAGDGEGFSASDSLTLFVGGTLGLMVSTSNASPAVGGVAPTGIAQLSTHVYGGTPPYAYEWRVIDPGGQDDPGRLNDPFSEAPTFSSDLVAGQYLATCTVTDASGATAVDGVLLNVGQPLNVDVSVDKQSLTGGGGVGGRAQLITTLNGGVGPYRFQWAVYDPNNVADLTRLSDDTIASPVFTSDLNTGTYRATLTTTDAMGVVFVDSLELVVGSTGGGADGQNLSASVSIDRQKLPTGGETAGASVLTTGGVPPLAYAWSVTDPNGNSADDRLDSTAAEAVTFTSDSLQGTYRLRCRVSDGVGNTFTDSVQLTVSDDFHVDLSGSKNHLVPGAAVELTANRTGGSGPFTYSWKCVDLSGNSAGVFTSGSIGPGEALSAGADDVTNVWQAPSGPGSMGNYRLTVVCTDAAGRSFTDSMTVTVSDTLLVQLTAHRVHVAPGQSITLTADRTGGSPNFTYAWNCRNQAGNLAGTFTTGSTGTGSASQIAADDSTNTWTAPSAGPGTLGTYRIQVAAIDANGISFGDTVMVVVDEAFSLDLRASDAAIAAGGSTTLTADRTGGERNFSFVWTARNSLGAAAGSFSSGSTGIGTATQNNRTNDTTNVWTAPTGIADTYLVTCVATDALGRTFTDSTQVRVGADNPLLVSLSSSRTYILPGEPVNLAADQQNGVANLSYTWSAVDESGAAAGVLGATTQSGLAGDAANTWTAPALGAGVLGTYRIAVTATDALGRQATEITNVVVHSPLSLDVQASDVLVAPSGPVGLKAAPQGGEPPYDYVWQAVDGTGSNAGTFTVGSVGTGAASQDDEAGEASNAWSVAAEGAYTVICTVTDNAGQVFTDSVSLLVTTQDVVLLDLAADALSVGPGETVTLWANHIGGTANYNYAWLAINEAGTPAGTLGAATQNGLAGDAVNTWTAPVTDGTYRIQCTVTDFGGRRSADTIMVRVSSLAVQNLFLAPPASDSQSLLSERALLTSVLNPDPGRQFFPADGLVSPAHPRNVVISIYDNNASISGGFVRISGLDARGLAQSEVITIPATSGSISTSVGQMPFATIHRVDAFGFTGNINVFGQTDTISIGVGNEFGLTGLLRFASDVPYVYEGSTVRTSGFLLDLTPGQQGITFATPPNGVRNYMVVFRAR